MTLASLRKGWCPGALRPMASGDGLVVRVRAHAGRLPLPSVIAIAAAAERFGNGKLDITQRASLQIRGVTNESHGTLIDRLDALGLIDTDQASEAIRNIVVDAFGGLVPGHDDVRELALELERAIAGHPDLHALPGKFGFTVEAGSGSSFTGISADIHIETAAGRFVVAPHGANSGLAAGRAEIVPLALEMARAFLHHPRVLAGAARRMKPLTAAVGENAFLRSFARPVVPRPAPIAPPGPGLLASDEAATGVVVGFAFGRIEADTLRQLAERAVAMGAGELRISPWRSVVLPGLDARFLAEIGDLDVITRADHPLMRIDACPGAPQCSSAAVATHGAARAIAGVMARLGDEATTIHVSGCIKGCARMRAADIVAVGRDGAFDLVRNGRPADPAIVAGLSETDLLRKINLLLESA